MRIFLIAIITILGNFSIVAQTGGSYNVSGGDSSCLVIANRSQLLALRLSNSLDVGCHYRLTDYANGRLVAGTIITLHADSNSEFSENVTVNTTYDNEGWSGIYDIDRNLVLELKDNRGNIARGFNGTEVANFDWGNSFITNVLLDNSTWTTTYGASRTVTNCEIKEGSVLTTTSQTGGTISRLNLIGASTLTTATANVSITGCTIDRSSVVNLTSFTAGSNMQNYTLYNATINFSNSTSGVTLQIVRITNSTFNHTGVTTGTITGTNLIMENACSINHNNGAGNLSLNRVNMLGQAQINHTSGTISLTNYVLENNGNVVQNTGTTGVINLSDGILTGNGFVQNLGDYTINGTRFSAYENSTFSTQILAVGTATLTGTSLYNASSISITSASTAGNVSITGTNMKGASNINKNGTGLLTISNSEFNSNGRILFSSVRGLSCTRVSVSNLATIQSTATAGAGVTDGVTDVSLNSRATLTHNATGALGNNFSQCSATGLSGALTIGGTSTANTIQRGIANGATIQMSGNVTNTVNIAIAENVGNINVQNMTVTKTMNYLTSRNNGSINITNPTGAGSISFIFSENGSNITISGTAGTSSYLYARNQGAIAHNGGNSTNITKDMVGTITTGNFTHSNLYMISPTSITLTANNANRATYLGVVSSVPLF